MIALFLAFTAGAMAALSFVEWCQQIFDWKETAVVSVIAGAVALVSWSLQ